MSPTRRTKQGLLAQVFPGTSQRMMHAWIAQVCVLFEDLNLEVNGFYNKTLPEEAHARLEYSQLYFLRRAIGTLREFQTGITTLDRDADFQVVKKRFKSESSREWDDAVRYFEGNKLKQWLSSICNDVGGHFGGKTALYAIEHMPNTAVGTIELDISATKSPLAHPLRLHFCTSIATVALLKHSRKTVQQDQANEIITECVTAHRYATNATKGLVEYLWPRFR